jgi:hypothetical protein
MKVKQTHSGNVKITLTFDQALALKALLNVSHLLSDTTFLGRSHTQEEVEVVSRKLHSKLSDMANQGYGD